MTKNNFFTYLRVLALFVLAALILRWPSFFPSVINHDESTYIVIADAIRAGKMYFVDVIDNKPIGIFLLFAFFQKILGPSIVMIRIAAAVWVAVTAFFLFLIHKRFQSSESAGWASGLIYIFITSIFTDFGLSPNTELFFNLFTVAALFLLVPQPKILPSLVAGILLGMGFLIKYVVAFDALAFGLFIVWCHWNKGMAYLLKTGVLMLAGFCIPVSMVYVFYLNAGQLDALMYYTFELTRKYVSSLSPGAYAVFTGDMFLRFLPVSFWFFYGFTSKSQTRTDLKVLGGLWSVMVFMAVFFPGKLFYHYFIQFMLPYALLAGSFFDGREVHGRFWRFWMQYKTGGAFLVVLALANTVIQIKDMVLKPDVPREVASWLKERLKPGEMVYTGNYHQIIYHLLDQHSPTPYVHRSLMANPKNMYAQGIDHNTEMKKVLDQKPAYIIIQKEYPVPASILHEVVSRQYKLHKEFGKDIKVYHRMSE